MTKRKTKHFVAPGERGAYCSASDPIGLTENIAKVSCVKCLKRLLKLPAEALQPAPDPLAAPVGVSLFEALDTSGPICAWSAELKLVMAVGEKRIVAWRVLDDGSLLRVRHSELKPEVFIQLANERLAACGVDLRAPDGGSWNRLVEDD